MCDVIKIHLKGRMRGEVGKETPQKEMDFYDVTHDTLGFLTIDLSYIVIVYRKRRPFFTFFT